MSPPPTLLIVGATGNTGHPLVTHLSTHLPSSPTLSTHRILALTRTASSPTARALALLPSVHVAEKNWVDIDAAWLRAHNVVRAFIASHNGPAHFTHESGFHVACLDAGVGYVVRISTTAANVSPVCKAYYPRAHWAVEQILSSKDFEALGWTSLQPNVFAQVYLGPAAGFVKEVKEGEGKEQGVLRLMADESARVGVIDASDIGIFAARLLLERDTAPHHGEKYVLNGPRDITGRDIVDLVEREIGTKVEDVRFRDVSFVADMAEQEGEDTKSAVASIKFAPVTAWEGECGVETTSRKVRALGAPKRSVGDVWREMLEG